MHTSSNSLTPTLQHRLPANSVVCLMAPTASGKTALAYELYDTGRYELISVDSALIYRNMNIGTAKPTADELHCYPHHLVDIIDPTQSYSVAEFVKDVERLIDNCHKKDKIPLLVGGTMMYYIAIIEGLSPVPDSDKAIRERVEQWRQSKGIHALYDYLREVDTLTHERLKPADTQRITRAIEVYLQTERPLSAWQHEPKQALAHNPKQNWHVLSVIPERPWLHERIGRRLDIMWDEGLVTEVIGLLQNYALTPNMPSMRCVGYRQVLEYLVTIQHPIFDQPHLDKAQFIDTFSDDNIVTDTNYKGAKQLILNDNSLALTSKTQQLAHQDMQNKALYATRQLAKRQYTWLRKLSNLPNTVANMQSFDTMKEAREYLR